MQLVRGSEISDFLRCRWKWNKAWIEGIQPIRQDGKLFFGTLFHKFVEVYYAHLDCCEDAAKQAYDAMLQLFQETDTTRMEQVQLDELWDLIVEVTQNYVKMWAEQDKNWTIIAQELAFAIPLDDEIAYTGTIDLVFRDGDGRLFFMDHKTTDVIDKYAKAAELDRQISRYWWALQQLAAGNGYLMSEEGWYPVKDDLYYMEHLSNPAGFIYNIVRKDYPTPPKLLKPTKAKPVALSVAKQQLTTHALYIQALRDNGLMIQVAPGVEQVPEEYHEILDHLLAQENEFGNQFFQRVPVTRMNAELSSAMNEFYAQAHDAHVIRQFGVEDRAIYRNIISDRCAWDCQYKSLCLAAMDGSNVEMLQNLMYEKRENMEVPPL